MQRSLIPFISDTSKLLHCHNNKLVFSSVFNKEQISPSSYQGIRPWHITILMRRQLAFLYHCLLVNLFAKTNRLKKKEEKHWRRLKTRLSGRRPNTHQSTRTLLPQRPQPQPQLQPRPKPQQVFLIFVSGPFIDCVRGSHN